MAQTVVGMFKYQEGVEGAISELKDLNYDPADFSVIMREVRQGEEIEESKGTDIAKGTASGAVVGGVVAGAVGFLVGVGMLTIPGLGALLVSGPLAAALSITGATAATTTAAVTGALAGGLLGALVNFGFSEEEAKQYEEYVRAGGILVIIPVRDRRTSEVRDILTKHGASDVRQLELHSETLAHKTT